MSEEKREPNRSPSPPSKKRRTEEEDVTLEQLLAEGNREVINTYFRDHPIESIEITFEYLHLTSNNPNLTAEDKKSLLEILMNRQDKTGFTFLHNLILAAEKGFLPLDDLVDIVNRYKASITLDSCYLILDDILQNEKTDAILYILALDNTPFQDAISKKITVRNQFGNTLLHLACMATEIDTIEKLITPESVNVCNAEGSTPLHITMQLDKPAFAHALMLANADCSIKNRNGRTPLAEAIAYKSQSALTFILTSGFFDKNDLGHVHELLMVTFRDQLLAIETLLTYIDLTTTDYNGFHVLHYALLFDHTEGINFLLQHQAFNLLDTPDPMGRNLFCFVRSFKTLRLLLEKKGTAAFQELVNVDNFDLRAIDWLHVIDFQTDNKNPILTSSLIEYLVKTGNHEKSLYLPRMLSKIRKTLCDNPEMYSLSPGKPETPLDILCSSIFFMNPQHKAYYQKTLWITLEKLFSNNVMADFLNAQCHIIQHHYHTSALFSISNNELEQIRLSLIEINDFEVLKDFILNHEEFSQFKNHAFQTLLHLAVNDSNVMLVQALLETEIPVNAIDKNKKTCLDYCQNDSIRHMLMAKNAKKGDAIETISSVEIKREDHFTIFTGWGDNLLGFPTVATLDSGGSYDRGFTVFIVSESVNLKSDMVHEWAHRFALLSGIDLTKAVENYFSVFKACEGKLKSSGTAEEDCASILSRSLKYVDTKQREEFFVRWLEIIAKHGDVAMHFLKSNFGDEIEHLLHRIVRKDSHFLIAEETSDSLTPSLTLPFSQPILSQPQSQLPQPTTPESPQQSTPTIPKPKER